MIKKFNEQLLDEARAYVDQLTKPLGSLGRVEQLAVQLVGITGELKPSVDKPAIIVAAADHGIVEEGVSAYPQEVTVLMLNNFIRGRAAINVFSRPIGAEVTVIDVGVKGNLDGLPIAHHKIRQGTRNFLREDAMTIAEAEKAIEIGRSVASEKIAAGHRLLITGEMGIGNTTASSALVAALTGASVNDVVGNGTGLEEDGRLQKVKTIEKALEAREITGQMNPLQILAKVGGYEIATLAGVILEGARQSIPVLVDGFISSAAALVAAKLDEAVLPYLMIAHQSAERGHKSVADYLNIQPILQLDLCLGEGTGAALAYPIVEGAARIMSEMATFEELGL